MRTAHVPPRALPEPPGQHAPARLAFLALAAGLLAYMVLVGALAAAAAFTAGRGEPEREECPACGGTGLDPAAPGRICAACDGRGWQTKDAAGAPLEED